MNKPHKHAEVIKAWADGAIIQVKQCGGPYKGEWQDITWTPSWNIDSEYRLKPEVTTSLSDDVLIDVYWSKHPNSGLRRDNGKPFFPGLLRAVADAAIKQYIAEQGK